VIFNRLFVRLMVMLHGRSRVSISRNLQNYAIYDLKIYWPSIQVN